MENTPKNRMVKNGVLISVLIISIIVIGISFSYAFYTAGIVGNSKINQNSAAKLNVTTTLTSTNAISAAELALIDSSEYLTKAEKVSFSVTNNNDSTIKAKYTIKLEELSLSKNLFSKYFKWALVINGGLENEKVFTGDFADESISLEGNSDTTMVTNLSKILITDEEALLLDINATDSIEFYIWLENDPILDQLYLINGNFSGKLSLDAVPSR